MSTFNRIVVTFGLSVVCSSGWVPARGQAAAEPSPPESPPAAEARPSRERFVLLTNGQLIRGIVTESEAEFLIEQRVGVMHFPKKRVEGSFDSIREAFEYRLGQLPDRDSDERMKLALWCLNLKLAAEARELLTSVLQQNPKHQQARAMLASIDQAATRLARRERDPEVRQTRRAEEMADGRPEALDSAVLRYAQRGLRIKDQPVIFDLPLPLAIKRTEEFTKYVHPLLQAYCAKCHDGQYEGEFQLVPMKSRSERTSNALRANLDATLRLVDPANPSHSVLLSSTLRPHGHGAKPRPIFPGSNDRVYKVLAEWANHLTAPQDGDESARTDPARSRAADEEVFAADKNRSRSARLKKGSTTSSKMPSPPGSLPRMNAAAGQNSNDPQEFPIPFAISGVKPNPAVPKKAADPSPKRPGSGASSKPAAAGGPATPRPGDRAKPASPEDDPDDLPDLPKGKADSAAAKKAAKPLAIDPNLLEKALLNRNANRQNPSGN